MTIDLWMLVCAVGLTWVLMMAASTPNLYADMPWALGNREEPRDLASGLAGRLQRASTNMEENLPLFAALVLVVHVAGAASETSALGAQVFVGARVVHALVYAIGIPVLRTVVWAVSVGGMVMVASALL